MAYEMVMPYHLHMPSYFLETFTEYPYLIKRQALFRNKACHANLKQPTKEIDNFGQLSNKKQFSVFR